MGSNVLLGISGGIAAYKTPDLVRRLRERGFGVRVAMTESAKAFVSPLALEVVSGHRVRGDDYLEARGRGEEEHVVAADWADLLLVAPATAHLLARAALGLADDFLSTTLLAFPGPLFVAPAMHPEMWETPALQGHLKTLRERGVTILGPEEGPLASGEVGTGRMMEPVDLAEALAVSAESPWQGKRVVVTAGPTHEPLDPVRFLGNRSSGKMGFALAREAAFRGAEVTLVAGPVSLTTPPGVSRIDVETAREMRDAVVAASEGADAVLMAAAVSDYRPRDEARQKMKKTEGVPELRLEENPDILAELGSGSGEERLLVGFAAETEELEAHGREKLESKGCDYLVANDVSRPDIAFGSEANEVVVFRRAGEPVPFERQSKRRLAARLLDLFEESLPD